MIQRLVLLKFTHSGMTDEVAAAAHRDLPRVPGVREVRVGRPADADAAVWDLLLAVTFDRIEDVAVYQVDPLHRAFVDQVLTPRVQVRKAWNFALDP